VADPHGPVVAPNARRAIPPSVCGQYATGQRRTLIFVRHSCELVVERLWFCPSTGVRRLVVCSDECRGDRPVRKLRARACRRRGPTDRQRLARPRFARPQPNGDSVVFAVVPGRRSRPFALPSEHKRPREGHQGPRATKASGPVAGNDEPQLRLRLRELHSLYRVCHLMWLLERLVVSERGSRGSYASRRRGISRVTQILGCNSILPVIALVSPHQAFAESVSPAKAWFLSLRRVITHHQLRFAFRLLASLLEVAPIGRYVLVERR
jgi:hypothetical protein